MGLFYPPSKSRVKKLIFYCPLVKDYSEISRYKVHGLADELQDYVTSILLFETAFADNTRIPPQKTMKAKPTRTNVGKVFREEYTLPKDYKKTEGHRARARGIEHLQAQINSNAHGDGSSSDEDMDRNQFEDVDMNVSLGAPPAKKSKTCSKRDFLMEIMEDNKRSNNEQQDLAKERNMMIANYLQAKNDRGLSTDKETKYIQIINASDKEGFAYNVELTNLGDIIENVSEYMDLGTNRIKKVLKSYSGEKTSIVTNAHQLQCEGLVECSQITRDKVPYLLFKT